MKNNWKIVKLGDVAETGAGGTPLKSHNEYYENGTIPWLRSGEVDKKYITESELYITELGLKNSSAKIFPVNTVLVAMYGATAGQVGILRLEASTNQAICGIFPNKRYVPEYLYYYFVYSKKELVSQAVGGAQANISQIKICNTSIPLPPLTEQKSIVKKLDVAFEKIERARENAEKSLADAKELFQSELSKLIIDNGEWKIVKLGEVAETGAGGTPLKSHNEYYENGNIPWLRSGEVDKKYITGSELYITELGLKNSSAKIFPINTVLVAMYGATAGQVGILRLEASTNQAICGIFPNKRYVPEYLYYYFVYSKKELVSQAVGGAQANISQIKICNTSIPLPPLEMQKSIVAQLDSLIEQIRKLEQNYTRILADCDELKQSILSKTFGAIDS